MKTCIRCNSQKAFDDFYKAVENKDGYSNSCKECVKAYKREYRKSNQDKMRTRDRVRYLDPKRAEWIRQYCLSERGKNARNKGGRLSRLKYPHANKARFLAWSAIQKGEITRETECSICKSTKMIQAHHDDYTKPLEVRWLCKQCHSDWHRKNTPIYGEGDG